LRDTRCILVVEDDPAQRMLLEGYLETAGYRVLTAADAESFRSAWNHSAVDLVLLDLNLPDADGLELAQRLRRLSEVPLIMVTCRDQDADRIAGLDLGADDYVTKPYHPRELTARIHNVLRRSARGGGPRREGAAADEVHWFAGHSLDVRRRRLLSPEQLEIPLTRGEFDLLAALARARGRVLSRDQLIDVVSTRDEPPMSRTIDVLVSRLRRKLEDGLNARRLLETVPGYGYRLDA